MRYIPPSLFIKKFCTCNLKQYQQHTLQQQIISISDPFLRSISKQFPNNQKLFELNKQEWLDILLAFISSKCIHESAHLHLRMMKNTWDFQTKQILYDNQHQAEAGNILETYLFGQCIKMINFNLQFAQLILNENIWKIFGKSKTKKNLNFFKNALNNEDKLLRQICSKIKKKKQKNI